MQLLQSLRDSSTIDSITEGLREVEFKAREISKKIIGFLTQASGNIIVYSYTGFGYVAASLLYWSALTFSSSKHPVIAESEEASIYILPYREDVSVLVFSTGEYSRLVQSLQVMRLLGIDYYAVAPTAPNETIKSILRHYGIEEAPYTDPIDMAVYTTLASFFVASELYKGGLGARGLRLHKHGEEGFTSTVRDFIEKYVSALEFILSSRTSNLVVTSSRFLGYTTLFFTNILREIGISAIYLPLEEATSTQQVILGLFLSTEERARRELKSRKASQLYDLVINLDPLEAIVYLTILAYVLYKAGSSMRRL